MPRVPIETNRVGIAEVTGAKLQPADGAGAGMQALGAGGQDLAGALSHAAEVQQQVDINLDHAGAKQLDNDFVTQAAEIRAGYRARNGLDAGAARPDTLKALADLRESTLGKATTPRMKEMLADSVSGRMVGLLDEVDAHYRSETDRADTAASAARVTVSAEEAKATTDPDTRLASINTGKMEIATRNAKLGFGSEVTTADQFKFESDVHAGVARNLIVDEHVDAALSYIDQHKDQISDGDERDLRTLLKAPLERRDTNAYVNGVMGSATAEGGATFSYGDSLHGAGRTPVPGGEFNAARDYGSHHGIDKPAPIGTPVYATGPGTATVSHSAKGGTIVTVDHGGGNITKYMHLGKTNISDGDVVTPDTVIGSVGMTGRSTGPHLHYEVWKNGKPVDPATVIGQVQQSPQRHDLNSLLGAVDKDLGAGKITPEQADRYKDEIRRRVGMDETLMARTEQDAERRAADAVAAIGADKFTSTSQIPADVWAALPSTTKIAYQNAARAKSNPPEVKPYGEAFLRLEDMANNRPDEFKRFDLSTVQPFLTPGEYARFASDKAKAKNTPSSLSSIRSEISSTIRTYGEDVGLTLKPGQKPEELPAYGRVSDIMRTYLDRATNGGARVPTDDEMKAAFDSATMQVVVHGQGWFGGDQAKRRFEVENGAAGVAVPVPNDVRARIIGAYKAEGGGAPTEAQIAQLYLQNKGKPGFWR
jgi:murein DD-endopeptidase MepM/ murein hydrolase activator NlpD